MMQEIEKAVRQELKKIKPTTEVKEMAYLYRKNGWTYKEIRDQLYLDYEVSVSVTTVRNWIYQMLFKERYG